MRVAFSVSDSDIEYAESVLLPKGHAFDEERRSFIRNLGPLDLQAVPGSGKTTALLAKLLILDRYLPFVDSSGILVISHTNAAIDEIRSKIGTHCKALFRYPNFVGTIQGFVDEFLAVPYFTNRYKRQPVRIDDEIREQKFAELPFGLKGFSKEENKRALYFLRANKKPIRLSLVEGNMLLTEGYMGSPIAFRKPIGNTKPGNYSDWSEGEKARVSEWITKFVRGILASGHLCYDDAYFLADAFLSKNGYAKKLLQARFSHVFVDEMQDMKKHQHDLLERIFFDNGSATSAFQRIGDKNQAIYDERGHAANGFWNDRATVLQLNGSYRLSPVLASVVSTFSVSPLLIEGRGKNPDGSDISIKPKFIVYSDSTVAQVLSRFTGVVRSELDGGTIPADARNKYSAVAWSTKPDIGKIRLCDYHPRFSREEQQQRADYPNLESYLRGYDRRARTLASVELGISGAILRVLKIEGAADESTSLSFDKNTLKSFLINAHPQHWQAHQTKVFHWCLKAVSGKEDEVVREMREYLPSFVTLFGTELKRSKDFVNEPCNVSMQTGNTKPAATSANIFSSHGVDVRVSTVHAVKGETHTATLYMESHYQRGGGGSYESERLAAQLKGDFLVLNTHDLARQSAKMVYVGFSRPTHLLCFAIHENRFAKLANDIDTSVWDVIKLVADEGTKLERPTEPFNCP